MSDLWGGAPEPLLGDLPIFRDAATVYYPPTAITSHRTARSDTGHANNAGDGSKHLRVGVIDEMSDVLSILRFVDIVIDYYIATINAHTGGGVMSLGGVRVVQAVLLGAPLFFGVVALAVWMLVGGGARSHTISAKRV